MNIKPSIICIVFLAAVLSCGAVPIFVENYSFENPAGIKCKNWDGETTYPDVPGWTDGAATSLDSGIEPFATTSDGLNRGFLMGNTQGTGDPGVYQVTNHVIAAGESYLLTVDLRNDWNAPTHQLGLYYTGDGVTLVQLVLETVNLTSTWAAYTAQYSVVAGDAAIGKNLVIKLNNNGAGWSNMDNVRLTMEYVNVVIPANGAQTVGVDTNLEWGVAHGWTCDVYFGKQNDPNMTLNPKVVNNQVQTAYNPPVDLSNDTTYYWRVDAHEPNIPNDIVHVGPTWSFKTVPANASISAVTSAFTAVNAGTSVTLSVTGVSVTSYQWFKIGSPDVQLTEGAKYSNVTTNTLTVNNIQQADEGYYYCVGSNTIPTSASNRATGPGRVMIKRLTSYYPMEVITVVDGNDVTPDTVDGLTMTLKQEGTAGFATLAAGVTELGGNGLLFNNSDTDPNGRYAQIGAGVVNYEDITIEVWCKWNGGANWQRIVDFGNDITHYMFLTPSNGTEARFVMKNGSGAEQIVSTSPLSTGQWVHVAATLSGNTGRLYVNGELKATNTGVTVNPIDFKPTVNYIAKSQYTADPEFDGTLDDLKIYNYARTSMEIAQDYTAVKGGWVCNMEGTASMKYDLDKNCRVDLADFALIAADWLESNRIYPIQ